MKKIYFIGSLGGKKKSIDGSSIKNLILFNEISKLINIEKIDTRNWRKNLITIVKVFKVLFFTQKFTNVVLSANSYGAYPFLKINKKCKYLTSKKIYYFVIGSELVEKLEKNILDKKYFQDSLVKKIYVETENMKERLNQLEILNVEVIKNFKEIPQEIFKTKNIIEGRVKCFFLSRIVKEKGFELIFKLLNKINEKEIKIEVDFFGPILPSEKEEFLKKISETKGACYKGCLDFINDKETSYKKLLKYNTMLFPTLFKNEGHPGVLIDSMGIGVPVISSYLKNFEDFIKHGENGIFLNKEMKKILKKKY
ncbi:glycosyltransferase [Cetobacterium somerae]|uniref:glycosyltransferase n=1 Tax=Cetobacterium somerae TaxID=188913 RepID=UPI00389249EF